MEGFIVVKKKIRNWKWWKNPTARSLWFYILLEANWKDEYDMHGNLIERGSFIRSLRTMEEECGFTVKTIRAWLRKFEASGEIKVEKVSGYTKIIVLNYKKYQDYSPENSKKTVVNETTPSTTPSTTADTTVSTTPSTTDRTIYNHSNNSNNNKRSFTPPTVEEVKQYCSERHNSVDPQVFVDFYSAKGWMVGKNHMKDWKACVRTWERNRSGSKVQVKVPDYIDKQLNGDYEGDMHLW